ncbi:MAG: alpha,2-mannosyltransferase [Chloroflexota bacterium]|jgi:hypothetical protein|nr:alpha,2-mannosyltransferase [Chloroflexota bacterium]
MSLRNVYGIRLFYLERARNRFAVPLAVAAVLVYIYRSIEQQVNFEVAVDFTFYRSAAVSLANNLDPYQGFLAVCPRPGTSCGGFNGFYIYPPLLAELMRPLVGMSVIDGARLWTLADHVLLIVCIVVAYRTVGGWLSPAGRALLLAAAMVFLPLYENLYFMQVNMFLVVLLVVAAHYYVRQPGGVGAGVALAVASVLRVTPAPLGLTLARLPLGRRRVPAVLAMAATGVVLLGVLALLTPSTIEYLTVVLPRLSGSTPWVENLSVPAVLMRARELAPQLATPLLYLIPLLSVAFLGVTWWRSRGIEDARGRALVFAALLAAIPILSSVTEQHHLVAELLVFALLAPALRIGSRPWWLALAAYPLLWFGHDDGYNFLLTQSWDVSYWLALQMLVPVNLVGMILLWLACLEAIRRHRLSASRASPHAGGDA